MGLNYYPRYPGDYLIKTVGITMIEDGAYTRMLDWYYANETPIEHDGRYEVARATTASAKEAVDKVLKRFFSRAGNVWRHERADEEIAKAAPRIEAAKVNGSRGGRKPKKNPPGNPNDNPTGNPSGNPPTNPAGNPLGNPNGTQWASSPYPDPEEEEQSSGPAQGAGARELPGTAGAEPTAYGAITRQLKAAGLSRVNPGELRFRALVDAGATGDEFLAYVPRALKADDPFAYLVATVEGERKRIAANAGGLHTGPIPKQRTARERDAENAAETFRRMAGSAYSALAGTSPSDDIVDMEPTHAPRIGNG